MQSFRASPWVPYEPSPSTQNNRDHRSLGSEMDEDVDMDAPQISTLREEDSPPPQAQKKSIVTPKNRHPAATATSVETWVRGNTGGEADEIEEEDQLVDELIDDENDDLARPSSSTDLAQKRKGVAKRKQPRKADKKVGDGDKKVKVPQPTDREFMNSSPMPVPVEPPVLKAKKKISPRKPPTIPRAKTKVAKQKSAIPSLLLEDASVLSDSYAGTAASSPATAPFEQNSPEPENIPPSSPPLASAPLPGMDETNLEGVPIPVYPLPTKPFPVQPPPKIPTGFAPLIPLDRSGGKVRHWREANREIRGIAGGRWLAKTWVGNKESTYAINNNGVNPQGKAADDKSSTGVALPKLPSLSAPGTLKIGKLKASSKSASAVTSAAASRAPSVIPEPQGNSITSTVRAPTKMRISQQATSEGWDSDMVPPIDL